MIWRSFFLMLSLFLVALFEASFVSALPAPFSALPFVFVFGVLLYHFVRPNIGAAWLVVGGILLDVFSAPGPAHVLSFAISAGLGALLARKVFANRSLYATVGLGMCMYGCALIVEELWLVMANNADGRPLSLTALSAYFWSQLTVFTLALLVMFGASRRSATALRQFFFIRT